MSFERPLRGHCACFRNQYFIRAPEGVVETAQVLFGTGESHRIAQATPLSAHLRIPLAWYHSATFSHYPDETAAQIRRVFENPFENHTRRTFCGLCGTPLTYWSEHPRAEAAYIQVTIGSLRREDLGDLEDLGLIPEPPAVEAQQFDITARGGRQDPAATATATTAAAAAATAETEAAGPAAALHPIGAGREVDIPWFDNIMQGSRLSARLMNTRGTRQSADGEIRIEFEITEYNSEEDDGADTGGSSGSIGKRKLGDRDDVEDREGVEAEQL